MAGLDIELKSRRGSTKTLKIKTSVVFGGAFKIFELKRQIQIIKKILT